MSSSLDVPVHISSQCSQAGEIGYTYKRQRAVARGGKGSIEGRQKEMGGQLAEISLLGKSEAFTS